MKKKVLLVGIAIALWAYIANAQSSTTTTTTTTTTNQTTTTPQNAAVQPATSATIRKEDEMHSSKFEGPRFYIGAILFGTASSFKVHTVENNNTVTAKTTATLGYGGGGYLGYNFCKYV